jgi:hypothetical protein
MSTIILGNGFDKHCGRKSSYSDFFEFLKAPNPAYENELWGATQINALNYYLQSLESEKYDKNLNDEVKKLNLWILYFSTVSTERNIKSEGDFHWCDVEKALRDALIGPDDKEEDPFFIDSIYHIIKEVGRGSVSLDVIGEIVLDFYRALNGRSFMSFNKHDFYYYLFSSLREFERLFASYLNFECLRADKENNFQEKSKRILSSQYFSGENKIYTYNYTEPLNNCDVNHIHGSLKSEPIFGISEDDLPNDIESQDLMYPFIKSSRRIGLNSAHKSSASWIRDLGEQSAVFYGSSLSRQDYGTLFELLDSIHFVNGSSDISSIQLTSGMPTMLYFVYSSKIGPNDECLKGKTEEEIKFAINQEKEKSALEATCNALRLLTDYLDAKSNGTFTRSKIKSFVNILFESKIAVIVPLDDSL